MAHENKILTCTALAIAIAFGVILTWKTVHAKHRLHSLHTSRSGSEKGPATEGTTIENESANYGTPEDALRSLASAARRGRFERLEDAVTPEIQRMLDSNPGPEMAEHVKEMGQLLGESKILQKQFLSDAEVSLLMQPQTQLKPMIVRMKKLDERWKLSGIVP